MNSYIHPNKEEERMMDRIPVPTGASHRVREKFMTVIRKQTSKHAWGIPAIVFSGVIAVFAVMAVTQKNSSSIDDVARLENGTNDILVSSSALMVNPYEVRNFRCEGSCQNLIVMGDSAPLFSDPTCVTCNEMLLWANLNGDGDAIVLGGEASIQGEFVSLLTQDLPLGQYPDWVGRTFPLGITGTDTVLNVTLQQTGEWNLITDVNCVSGCENIEVGVQRDSGINELLIDTCQPKPCNMFSIISAPIMDEVSLPENGIWTEDTWKGGYSVSVWKISSMFAFNGDHGEEIARVDYSPNQTADGQTLHFDHTVEGHGFVFDLVSALP